jgi:GDPmannose 4,6-dehydratase
MPTAFITGVTGQDGSYLLKHLLSLDYEVHGLIRRHSVTSDQTKRIDEYLNHPKVKLHYGDLTDRTSLNKVLSSVTFDEIYHLGAQSHVRLSFDLPEYTTNTNALGTLYLLESVLEHCPKAKMYNASSSEMFGNSCDPDGFQRETTNMIPVSPYGCSKLFAYNICRNYRSSYNLFVTNGILYNHESPMRGETFVTTKVVKGAVQLKLGQLDCLYLGNLSAYRDWGHAEDYCKAMHMMLQLNEPDDFVCATGVTHSVANLVDYVFDSLGVSKSLVKLDPRFLRPQELDYLRGDSAKLRNKTGWKPTYDFYSLLDSMISYWRTNLEK